MDGSLLLHLLHQYSYCCGGGAASLFLPVCFLRKMLSISLKNETHISKMRQVYLG